MSVAWTIAIDGAAPVSLDAAGVSGAQIRQANRAGGVATLTLTRRALTTAIPWRFGSAVAILRDGITWFAGHVRSLPRRATGSAQASHVEIHDAWWDLDHIVYQQPRSYASAADADANTPLDQITAAVVTSSRFYMGRDRNGYRCTTGGQIRDAIAYAAGKNAALASGNIDAALLAPLEDRQDSTCAEIVDRALFWHPAVATYFDYSTDPPTLHARNRGARSILDLVIPDEPITGIDLQPRHDLQVLGVTIQYLRTHQRDGYDYSTTESDTAGPTPAGLRSLVVSFELYGSYLNRAGNDVNGEPVYQVIAQEASPTGIATSIYDALSALQYSGTVTMVYQDLPEIHWMQRRLRLTGGAPEWAADSMDIQAVTEDIFAGTVSIELGPPSHLSPADFVSLLRDGRTPAPDPPSTGSTTAGTGSTGTAASGPTERFEYGDIPTAGLTLADLADYLEPFSGQKFNFNGSEANPPGGGYAPVTGPGPVPDMPTTPIGPIAESNFVSGPLSSTFRAHAVRDFSAPTGTQRTFRSTIGYWMQCRLNLTGLKQAILIGTKTTTYEYPGPEELNSTEPIHIGLAAGVADVLAQCGLAAMPSPPIVESAGFGQHPPTTVSVTLNLYIEAE